MASMTKGTETCSFKYDANGMRTKRSYGDKVYTYVYSGSQLTAMTYSSHKFLFTYDAAGKPLTLEYHDTFDCQAHTGGSCGSSCKTYYYVTNLQGDVIALLDSSGNVKAEYAYDAWGNHVETPSSFIGNYNPLRYRGYVYDRETKVYYLQSRYYNPEIGRFISADAYASTGQGILGNNMFAYCGNNPVNRIDPTGEKFMDWLNGAWNSVCNFFVGAYEYVTNTDETVAEENLVNDGFTFYKGVPVFSVDGLGTGGFSFGIIGIGSGNLGRDDFNDILNHEYGHFLHMLMLGPTDYFVTTALPSLAFAGLTNAGIFPHDYYHSLPWERTADILGGADFEHLPGTNLAALDFLRYTLVYSRLTP